MKRLLLCLAVFSVALVSLALISFSTELLLQDNTEQPTTTLPPGIELCYNRGNSYTLPALVLPETMVPSSVHYDITGATTRSGAGRDASGHLNPGINLVTWLVMEKGKSSSYSMLIKVQK